MVRERERFRVWFPVQIVAGQHARIAMAHNSSGSGMLAAVSSALKVGEHVVLRFQLPNSAQPHELSGRVLRLEPNAEDPQGAWPQRVAIAFDAVSPELEPYLNDAAQRFGPA